MKSILVAPVGDQMEALFVGIREFPIEKVILLAAEEMKEGARKTMQDLAKFKIPSHIITIDDSTEINVWEHTFRIFSEIRNSENDKDVLVSIETGDKVIRWAAMSGAFVNGFKAFAVLNDKAIMLPLMKFSYYKLIPDKKMDILKILHTDEVFSLEELSKRTSMSLPLISYHINGNLKSEGLKTMGLIETIEKRGRVFVKLNPLGKMVVRGYIK